MKSSHSFVSKAQLEAVNCPNCGQPAQRYHYHHAQEIVIETTCPACDYLLVNTQKGRVMDSYLATIRQD